MDQVQKANEVTGPRRRRWAQVNGAVGVVSVFGQQDRTNDHHAFHEDMPPLDLFAQSTASFTLSNGSAILLRDQDALRERSARACCSPRLQQSRVSRKKLSEP